MAQDMVFFQRLLVAILLVFGEGVFINTVLQTLTGKKKKKDISNPMKNPLLQRILIVFVGKWLLKTLLKLLVSVRKRRELIWFCWRLVISRILQKGRTEKHWRHSGDGVRWVTTWFCSFLV